MSRPVDGRAGNGFGRFSEDGREYVIRLEPLPGGGLALPPRPWINVIANETFGFLTSETGAGYTWSGNSRERRLTPWTNDPVADPHGEALYVRDERTGHYWSPLPGPAASGAAYEVRHGFGYSAYTTEFGGLEQETLLFAAAGDPIKVVRVRLVNRSTGDLRLSIFWYARLVLGSDPEESGRFVVTESEDGERLLLARGASAETSGAVVFATCTAPPGAAWRSTGDREAFIGRGGCVSAPVAVAAGGGAPTGAGAAAGAGAGAAAAAGLDGRTGAGLDPCFAQQVTFDLARGATAEVSFLFGEGHNLDAARSLAAAYSRPGAAERAFAEVRSFWDGLVSTLRVETPSPAIDLMVNGWLLHQTLSCRIRARSALYQSGGAFGYRDQLQDAGAFAMIRPEWMRAQILLHAAHQFPEGDVLHWWHPPAGRGLRTRFSDDLLWLPYLAADYIATTGDRAVLSEQAPFRTARLLEPGEDEAYLPTEAAAEEADVYEHCCRAIDRSLTEGPHGLPLIGVGDWNDAMNRVGREGRGESVWLGFFLYAILGTFTPFCRERNDAARAARYDAYRERLRAALETAGWDGGWYRRGYYDNGEPLGSASSDECRIDSLSQSWAVLSDAAPPARARQAMEAAEEHLVSRADGIIRLLTPPFDRTPDDPGYIKGYPPGVRENGGQYTHAALWTVRAAAELGWNERAAAWLEMLSPVSHTATPDAVAVYRGEPYVVAADVGGADPHRGRAGWTWYTGSSGWMFRVAVESVLGLRMVGGETLRLKPCVPDAWPGFRVSYRLPGSETRYEIEVTNPDGAARRVVSARLDGAPIRIEAGAALIPVARDGRTHRVAVVLGRGEA